MARLRPSGTSSGSAVLCTSTTVAPGVVAAWQAASSRARVASLLRRAGPEVSKLRRSSAWLSKGRPPPTAAASRPRSRAPPLLALGMPGTRDVAAAAPRLRRACESSERRAAACGRRQD